MAKKQVSGWLCRDNDIDGLIVFFRTLGEKDIVKNRHGCWCWKLSCVRWTESREWTIEKWESLYALKPPVKGTKFLVEIEL